MQLCRQSIDKLTASPASAHSRQAPTPHAPRQPPPLNSPAGRSFPVVRRAEGG
jgi:hypothetical protein